MAIPFNSVPSNIRVPFVAVEIDNTNATQGEALLNYRALMIGQKTSEGSATANTLYLVSSADQVAGLAGRGSQLHCMAKAYFKLNTSTETWIGVLADNGAGVAATGTLTVTGPATATGTLSLYVAGVLVSVAVTSGDVQNTIATNIAAAIGANTDLPVTASATTNVVTVTAKNKGVPGNLIDLRSNANNGDVTPAGVAVAVVAMASGATNPVLTSLISALGDNWFHVWAMPYTDATSLTAVEAELASRFGPMRMIDGHCIACTQDTVSGLATLGNGRNSPHVSLVDASNNLSQPLEIAAATLAQVALYGSIDPARPFQTLPLTGVVGANLNNRRLFSERNTLLFDGISTLRVMDDDSVQLERLITTYKTNAAGSPDTSYLDVNTMLTLMYARYSFRTRIQTKFPRAKLANDGTRIGAGQAVITPAIGKAEALLWFTDLEEAGLFENFEQFKANLVVERNATDPNRLDFLLPPDLINQFIVGAVNLQFIL